MRVLAMLACAIALLLGILGTPVAAAEELDPTTGPAAEFTPEPGAQEPLGTAAADSQPDADVAVDPIEPAAVEPQAAALASSPTSSTPLTVGPMTLIVHREYTGTGHGTTSQCAINSDNTELFPDGNLAAEPADDSPEDQYACHRDAIGYSLEFNFGSTTLTEPYKVTVTIDIRDQVGGEPLSNSTPYNFPADAEAMCGSSGMYNGRVLHVARNGSGTTMACEFEFLPGIAGTVKLPTLNFNYGASSSIITDRFNPQVSIKSGTQTFQVLDEPKTAVLAAPRIDPILQTNGVYFHMLNGTTPGILYSSKLQYNTINWPAPWSPTNGLLNSLSDPNSPTSTPPEIYYVSSFADSAGPNAFAPTALPQGAQILVGNAETQVFDAITGEKLPTIDLPGGSNIAVWIPNAVFSDNTGQSVLFRYEPTTTTGPNGEPNFVQAETWEPGYQEACNFSTASLGIVGVNNGSTTPNNDCNALTRSLDQLPWGRTGKAIMNGISSPETGPNGIVPITLHSNADLTGLDTDVQMCDTWDAPESLNTAYRGVTNTLNVAEPIRVSAIPKAVLIGWNGSYVSASNFTPVPAEVFRVEYRNSPEDWQGAAYTTGVAARCNAADGWFDSIEAAGGAAAVNTFRVLVDRSKLREWMITEVGLEGVGGWTPQLRVDFSMVAPPSEALDPDSINYAHDAYQRTGGSDGNFIEGLNYAVKDSYLRHYATKFVTVAGQSGQTTSVSVPPGSEVTFTLLPGRWFQPSYYSFYHGLPQPDDPLDYKLSYTDSLPKCAEYPADGSEPFTVLNPTSGLTWEYTPPVGDPCHGDGTPGKVTWILDAKRTSATADRVMPPQLRYNVTMRTDVLPGTNNPAPMSLSIEAVGDATLYDRNVGDHNAEASVYISPGPAEVGSSKTVDGPLVRTGERAGWTVTLMNMGSGDAGKTEWIDVLPYHGDTSVRGDERLHSELPSAVAPGTGRLTDLLVDEPVWSSTIESIPAPSELNITVWYTNADPATIVQDPNDPSNQPGGATNWCLAAQELCETTNATAVKFSIDKMRAFSKATIHFSASTQDLKHGAVLYNQLSIGRSAGLTLPIPLVAPVRTEVYDLLIDGVVWLDANGDAVLDADERLLEGAEVHLLNADGTPYLHAGQPVITLTDAQGYYWFGQGLRPDGSQPAASAYDEPPLFLPDGSYRTAVVRNGVVLATWAVTCSGGNTELPGVCVGGNPELDGSSLELDLGGSARTLPIEFTLYQKADFGLMEFPNAELPFTGGSHEQATMLIGGLLLLSAARAALRRRLPAAPRPSRDR